MVKHDERLKQLVNNDRKVNNISTIFSFSIIGIALLLRFTQDISLSFFAILLMISQLPVIYRAWKRMKLLLTFNQEPKYQRLVRIEFVGSLMNLGLLAILIVILIRIEGSIGLYVGMLLFLIVPFILLSMWVNRKLADVDAEHVTGQQLREAHREYLKRRV